MYLIITNNIFLNYYVIATLIIKFISFLNLSLMFFEFIIFLSVFVSIFICYFSANNFYVKYNKFLKEFLKEFLKIFIFILYIYLYFYFINLLYKIQN